MTNVLCLDGGGIRGLYTLEVLKIFEKEVGNINDYFDVIVGTSTGSIISTLIRFGYSIEEIEKIYIKTFPKIFFNKIGDGFLKPQYELENMTKELDELIKNQKVTKSLIITSINLSKRKPAIFKFDNVDETNMEELKQSVISSCSAPTLFKPNIVNGEYYSDGGIILNNPSLIGFLEAYKKENGDITKIKIASIGCMYEINEDKNIFKYDIIKTFTKPNINLDDSIDKSTNNKEQEENIFSKYIKDKTGLFSEKVGNKLFKLASSVIKIEEGSFLSYPDTYLNSIISSNTIHTNETLISMFKITNNRESFLRINHGVKEDLSLTSFKKEYYDIVKNDKNLEDKIKKFLNRIPNKDIKEIEIERLSKQNRIYKKNLKYLSFVIIVLAIIIIYI